MNYLKSIGLLLMPFALLIVSCQDSKYNIENLIGDWKVSKWEVESSGQIVNSTMDMTFKNDDKYEINYGSISEKGKYWIANEYLHTVEENRAEKKVRIMKLNADTLKIQMNRGGELENVLLTRK